ncbi:MAG: tRNA guanosine(34) transglycosylase Tgt [Phycisphaerales bacterium]
MAGALTFEIEARSGLARAGRVTTVHGSFETPAFMPVGTKGTVKGVLPRDVRATGAQILLNNTYHLMLRPGAELIAQLGGVHRFMGWDGPILTDSGGYQAYSMADINAVDDEGVTFKSIVDGSMIRLTPERAIEVQNLLGPDIIMAFDDCPPSVDPDAAPVNQTRLRQAVGRDTRRRAAYDHGPPRPRERTHGAVARAVQDAHDARTTSRCSASCRAGLTLTEGRGRPSGCGSTCPGTPSAASRWGEPPEDIRRIVEFTRRGCPAIAALPDGRRYERDIGRGAGRRGHVRPRAAHAERAEHVRVHDLGADPPEKRGVPR